MTPGEGAGSSFAFKVERTCYFMVNSAYGMAAFYCELDDTPTPTTVDTGRTVARSSYTCEECNV